MWIWPKYLDTNPKCKGASIFECGSLYKLCIIYLEGFLNPRWGLTFFDSFGLPKYKINLQNTDSHSGAPPFCEHTGRDWQRAQEAQSFCVGQLPGFYLLKPTMACIVALGALENVSKVVQRIFCQSEKRTKPYMQKTTSCLALKYLILRDIAFPLLSFGFNWKIKLDSR